MFARFLATTLLATLPLAALAQDDTDAPEMEDTDVDTDAPADNLDVYPTGGVTTQCSTAPGSGGWAWMGLLGLLALRRRAPRGTGGLAAVVILGAVATPAHAQDFTPALDVNRFEPSGMSSGFATVYTGRQLAQAKFSFDVVGSYAYRPFQVSFRVADSLVREGPGVGEAIEHLGAMHVRAAVGATDWFQIAIGAPVVQFLDTGPGLDTFAGPRSGPVGFGDVHLELGFRPLSEDKSVGLAITPFVTFPTGTRQYLLTDGTFAFGGRMALSGNVSVVHLAAHVGYKVKVGSSRLGAYLAVDDEILYGAGLGFQLLPQWVRLNVELAGASIVGPGRATVAPTLVTESLHTALEANANLMINTPSGFALMVGGGAGLTPAAGVPIARGFLGLGYVPVSIRDRDGDGIVDTADSCPDEPEDLDGVRDDDGCPDLDDDGDGVPDDQDLCPQEAEDMDDFEDGDGCPDLDDDGDGIPDTRDACPDDAEDIDGFEDADGCPDADNDGDGYPDDEDMCPDAAEDFDGEFDQDGCPDQDAGDTDGDGVPDNVDRCPQAAEDMDGFEDGDGCPDADNDGDGVPDASDACPNAPEDIDGFQDQDGCPDFDADGDGIPDAVDRCPEEPETVNGIDDTDGCPDEATVRLSTDRIEILESILFFVAEARIRPESFKILDQVATVMEQHPEILRIRIEGHTDSQGAATYNQDLSERRALAVRTYLIERGISPGRLLARGYGEDYPIAPNGSEEGRALNRRVDFMILADGAPEDGEK